MTSTHEFVYPLLIFAVYAFSSQTVSTKWFGVPGDFTEPDQGLSTSVNCAVKLVRGLWTLIVLGISGGYVFQHVDKNIEQYKYVQTLWALFAATALCNTKIILYKVFSRTKLSDNGKYAIPLSKVLEIRNPFAKKTDGSSLVKINDGLIDVATNYVFLLLVVVFNLYSQLGLYATGGRGTEDRIFSDWFVPISGFVSIALVFLFYHIGVKHTRENMVFIYKKKSMWHYEFDLPSWFQILMTVVTISSFTVFYGDYIRVFYVYFLFVMVVYGNLGWSGRSGLWYESFVNALLTLCEATFIPSAVFDFANKSHNMLADGRPSFVFLEWANFPAQFRFPKSGLYKVDLSFIVLTVMLMGVYTGMFMTSHSTMVWDGIWNSCKTRTKS